ncbi:MAG: DUF448 domain-containing protein, partial [Alphaproteobacteria bacterium]
MTQLAQALDDATPMAEGERRCLATGEVRPREAMLRFVAAPDPELGLVPDIAGTLPGRGLRTSATRAAVAAGAAARGGGLGA